jgi:hypothetical protein
MNFLKHYPALRQGIYLITTQPAVLAFERAITYLSLFSHNPTRWEEEKTHCELYLSALGGIYNYHGLNRACSRVGCNRLFFTVRSQAQLIWEEEKTS